MHTDTFYSGRPKRRSTDGWSGQDGAEQVTVPGAEKTKRGRPVTKPATGVDSAEAVGKQKATRGRGRPKKDKQKDGVSEQEKVTLVQSANDGGKETVTTMVNYVATTTWWNPVKEKGAGIESGESSVVPQPEDA